MTFRELAAGDRFLFVADVVPANPDLPETAIAHRVKDDDRLFTTHYQDGETTSWGRVGAGDNPVRRVS